MTNIFEPGWDAEQDRAPFRWRRARIGRQAGSQKLGASLYELPSGASTWPLHIHHANEELIIVLAGRPTLRSLDDERVLEPGEVVACPAGRGGAHRIDNRTTEAVRLLLVSTMIAPELNEYPTAASSGDWASPRVASTAQTRRRSSDAPRTTSTTSKENHDRAATRSSSEVRRVDRIRRGHSPAGYLLAGDFRRIANSGAPHSGQ